MKLNNTNKERFICLLSQRFKLHKLLIIHFFFATEIVGMVEREGRKREKIGDGRREIIRERLCRR